MPPIEPPHICALLDPVLNADPTALAALHPAEAYAFDVAHWKRVLATDGPLSLPTGALEPLPCSGRNALPFPSQLVLPSLAVVDAPNPAYPGWTRPFFETLRRNLSDPRPLRIAVTYSHCCCQQSRLILCKSAVATGRFDACFMATSTDLDAGFREAAKSVLRARRGSGYWSWKPYVILHTMIQLAPNDLVMYLDSGSELASSAEPLFPLVHNKGAHTPHVLAFQLSHPNSKFTRRDTFVALGVDTTAAHTSIQCLASFVLFENEPEALAFVHAWMHASLLEYVIGDTQNICGLPNLPGFVDHRHDQSVFSLLAFRHGLYCHRDPSQWGEAFINKHRADSPYPTIVKHTRNRD
jgi:hypothetical protein